MAEKYPGEEVSEQLDSSIESSASSCSSSASSRASSPDMLHSSLQEHLDSSNDPKGRTKTVNDPKGRTKTVKTVIDPKGRDKTTKVPEGQTKTAKPVKTTNDPEGRTKITVDPEGRKTRVQDLKLKAKMLGIKGYSKLNKKLLEVVLSIHPDPEPTVQSSAVSSAQPPAAQHEIEPKAQLPVVPHNGCHSWLHKFVIWTAVCALLYCVFFFKTNHQATFIQKYIYHPQYRKRRC